MGLIRLDNLKGVRRALGASQRELAGMLGMSTRAVQSYEQGWRDIPQHVQKMAGLLVYLSRRRRLPRRQPCWKIKDCSAEVRSRCPVYKFRAGDVCWLLSGDLCGGRKDKSWQDKMECCQSCPVMQDWLAI